MKKSDKDKFIIRNVIQKELPDVLNKLMPAKLILPEYIDVCRLCKGAGGYVQKYCDVPIAIDGPCPICNLKNGWMIGTGLVYKETGEAAPISVLAQVVNMNKGTNLPMKILGPPWKVFNRE